MTDFLKTALRGVQDLHGGVRTVRGQIAAAERELEDVRCAPTCRADVKAIYDKWIDSRAELYSERLQRQLVTMLRKPQHFDSLESQTARSFMAVLAVQPGPNGPDAKSIDEALMALLGPALKKEFFRVIDTIEWPATEGLPLAERAGKIDELEKKIKRLRDDEAELVQAASAHRIVLD